MLKLTQTTQSTTGAQIITGIAKRTHRLTGQWFGPMDIARAFRRAMGGGAVLIMWDQRGGLQMTPDDILSDVASELNNIVQLNVVELTHIEHALISELRVAFGLTGGVLILRCEGWWVRPMAMAYSRETRLGERMGMN